MPGVEIERAPTLEALLAQLLVPTRFVGSVSLTAAAAGDYAAGDVMSNSVTDTLGVPMYIPGIARTKGGVVNIQAIRAVCSEDAVLVTMRLHFFTLAPLPGEVEMDDNIAYTVKTAAGGAKFVGSLLLSPFVDRGTAVSTSDTVYSPIEPLHCDPNETGLFFVVVLETAEANETAGMDIRFDFYAL